MILNENTCYHMHKCWCHCHCQTPYKSKTLYHITWMFVFFHDINKIFNAVHIYIFIIIPITDHIGLTCNSITLPIHVDQFRNLIVTSLMDIPTKSLPSWDLTDWFLSPLWTYSVH